MNHMNAIPIGTPEQVTPQQLAQILRESGMAEDSVLDLLKRIGDKGGWTKQLNLVGAYYLKPNAVPCGDGEVAAA